MQISMLINGEAVPSQGGKTFERKDPVTGETATVAPAATVAHVTKAVAAAAEAFPAWSATSPAVRRSFLLKAADAIEASTDKIIAAMVAEFGATKPGLDLTVCSLGGCSERRPL